MSYVDLDDTEIENFPQVVEGLRRRELRLPVLMIDGEIAFQGGFAWRSVMRALEDKGIRAER